MSEGNFVKEVFVLFMAGIAFDSCGQNVFWSGVGWLGFVCLFACWGFFEEKLGCGLKLFLQAAAFGLNSSISNSSRTGMLCLNYLA